MEELQTRLLEAARQGSIGSLHQLLQEDSSILDRGVVNRFNETPLHIAAMLGHVDFVKKIIELEPELVNKLNSEGSSPLHLASAKGHVDVVRALLFADKQACLTPDINGLTPLHLAAAKGRVEVVNLLLREQPEATRLNVYGGGNILHLCVKRYQLEALKILVAGVGESPETEFINSKDDDGNTVLHLAVAYKQVETIKFLMSVSALEVGALNNEEMTAMDVLIQSRRDVRDSEIEKSLKNCEVFAPTKTDKPAVSRNQNEETQNNNGWLEKHKSALMAVAILIAIKAFQIGVTPQDDGHLVASSDHPSTIPAHKNLKGFDSIYISNVTSFLASLSIIILILISVLPLVRRFFMWVAITVALCYLFVIIVLTPNSYQEQTVFFEVVYTVIVCIILMALVTIVQTIRMILKLVKLVWRSFVG